MIKIALCDDNKTELKKLEEVMAECCKAFSDTWDCSIESFSGGQELLDCIKEGKYFDLVIIDIIMPDIYGTEIAKQIFELNKVMRIVFLTSSPEFAVESYNVDALDYLLKPVTKERLSVTLTKFFKQHKPRELEQLIIKERNIVSVIPMHSLAYVEALDHHIICHTSDGHTLNSRQTLSEVEKVLLQRSEFVKPNRSYLVNLDYIVKIDGGCITMKNGDEIYASRANSKELLDLFLRHKFERGKEVR